MGNTEDLPPKYFHTCDLQFDGAFDKIPVYSYHAMKLCRTSGRALYVSAQLASIKLCDMAARFNCQLLSEVTQLIESGYLCLSPVQQLYHLANDNDATFKKNREKTAVGLRKLTTVH